MNLNKLSKELQLELIKAYQENAFFRVQEIIIENKCMSGCNSCQYSHQLASRHIEQLIVKNK